MTTLNLTLTTTAAMIWDNNNNNNYNNNKTTITTTAKISTTKKQQVNSKSNSNDTIIIMITTTITTRNKIQSPTRMFPLITLYQSNWLTYLHALPCTSPVDIPPRLHFLTPHSIQHLHSLVVNEFGQRLVVTVVFADDDLNEFHLL